LAEEMTPAAISVPKLMFTSLKHFVPVWAQAAAGAMIKMQRCFFLYLDMLAEQIHVLHQI